MRSGDVFGANPRAEGVGHRGDVKLGDLTPGGGRRTGTGTAVATATPAGWFPLWYAERVPESAVRVCTGGGGGVRCVAPGHATVLMEAS